MSLTDYQPALLVIFLNVHVLLPEGRKPIRTDIREMFSLSKIASAPNSFDENSVTVWLLKPRLAYINQHS